MHACLVACMMDDKQQTTRTTSCLLIEVDVISASHLNCGLLVVLVVGQRGSSQHKVALLPVPHQTPLLFLQPAGLHRPLHGPGGARRARARGPFSGCHTPGSCCQTQAQRGQEESHEQVWQRRHRQSICSRVFPLCHTRAHRTTEGGVASSVQLQAGLSRSVSLWRMNESSCACPTSSRSDHQVGKRGT